MEIAKIEVSRADARKVHCSTLTSGMVGVEVSFSFDASWDGLVRLATFKAGGTRKDVALNADRAEIPHEVLAKPCSRLEVGIYGTDADGALVIPTVWADLGNVIRGAEPSGETSQEPTPAVWAQLLGMIGDIGKLDTEAKENLVAAINEVLHKGTNLEEVQRIVQEYLDENLDADAKDGFSPIATVTQTDTGAVISITDVNGTTEAVVANGKDGKDGRDGKDGADGAPGQPGTPGKDGKDGKDGADGKPGEDYVITDEDRADIAAQAAALVTPVQIITWGEGD